MTTTHDLLDHVEDTVRVGEQSGLVLGARHAVLRVLAARRLDTVCVSNRHAVLAESSVPQLMRWLAVAARANVGTALVGDDGTRDPARRRLRHQELPLVEDLLRFGSYRGVVAATRLALLRLTEARGLSCSEEERRTIDAEESVAQLIRWLDAALVAQSAAEILPNRSEEDDTELFRAIVDDRTE